MKPMLSRVLILAVLAGSALSIGGCAEEGLAKRDRPDVSGLRKADAYREAVRRCGSSQVRQAEGTDGSSPSDYICAGH